MRKLAVISVLSLFALAAAVLLFPPGGSDASAGNCCRVVVKGCSLQAKVCVPGACSSENQRKARKVFESAYKCESSSVSSYLGSCSNEKCDIDLR